VQKNQEQKRMTMTVISNYTGDNNANLVIFGCNLILQLLKEL